MAKTGERTRVALATEFDGLFARMQTSRARKGMASAFASTPSRLGRAAVAAAKKRGSGLAKVLFRFS